MDFSDKLNYLFDLTKASGKELATAMSVTPPQVSKMRKGLRGLPGSREFALVIARFFAERCNTEFQRDRLSKTIKIANVQWENDETVLAEIILNWLADDKIPGEYAAGRADDFLRRFGALYSPDPILAGNSLLNNRAPERSNFYAYYGNEGKRVAATTFLNHLLQLNKPFTIDILSDENIGWSTDDPYYSSQLHQTMVKLTEQGCVFRRISGPIVDMDQAFASLNRWFTLYMTGKATSYYYKRMRDNLGKITMFIVRNEAVMFSFSVGSAQRNTGVTFFTLDTKTTNSMEVEFENYLALCEPMMTVFSNEDRSSMHQCMISYEEHNSRCIQRNNSLSFITLPWEIANTICNNVNPDERDDFLTSFAKRYKSFKNNLENNLFIDIITLADSEAIAAGKVLIPASIVINKERQYYTPVGYLQHLRNVLYLLVHVDNYHVVIQDDEATDAAIIYVKEDNCVLLQRDCYPFTMYRVSERNLVEAFTELLLRSLPANKEENKKAAIERIRNLIAKIEKILRDK